MFHVPSSLFCTWLFSHTVLFQDDSPDLLASDVHTAGAGICNDSAVMKLAQEGPGRVEQMLLRGTSEVRVREREGEGERERGVKRLIAVDITKATTHRARELVSPNSMHPGSGTVFFSLLRTTLIFTVSPVFPLPANASIDLLFPPVYAASENSY